MVFSYIGVDFMEYDAMIRSCGSDPLTLRLSSDCFATWMPSAAAARQSVE